MSKLLYILVTSNFKRHLRGSQKSAENDDRHSYVKLENIAKFIIINRLHFIYYVQRNFLERQL